ncbi:MAG TPA: hypothetical protein EYN00_08395 [Planctomycetes bacterium]|nr:hypothetical protein [Planctomycetota bacterium]
MRRALLLLVPLLLVLPAIATAQAPNFDYCGVFENDPLGSCYLFLPYALPGSAYVISTAVPQPMPLPGVEARVIGFVPQTCASVCFLPCVFDATIDMDCGPPTSPQMARGDCNNDSGFNIADVVYLLANLFSGGEDPSCDDACDGNDDGSLNIADAVYSLTALFNGGASPPPPFPDCGIDPTDDALDCLVSACT